MIRGGQGDFFVQTDLSEPFDHLTCVGVGDLPLPYGDLTAVYCPDPANKGAFIIDDYIQGAPGLGSTTLVKPLENVANWLLENDCRFNALVTLACRGTRAIPTNFTVAALLFEAYPTTSTLLASVAQTPDDDGRIQTNADISYTDRRMLYSITMEVQDVDNTANANSIVFLPRACQSDCAPARGLCECGYMTLDGAIYNSEVKRTWNSGSVWSETTYEPFVNGGDAGPIIVLDTATAHRAIVGRISTSAGEYAEISWTEDWGITAWNNVYVGTVDGQTIHDLLYYGGDIYAVASGGYIYVSEDLGESWSIAESGTTAQDLNGIAMYNSLTGYAVGDLNAMLYVTDGIDWNSFTGPAAGVDLLDVAVNDNGDVFIGANDGNLYVLSETCGVYSWETRREFGAGSVDWVAFDATRRYFGALIWNDATTGVGYLYRSFDGGATWYRASGQTGAWNAGLNGGFICDQNNIYVVGDTFEGTTFVAKSKPTT